MVDQALPTGFQLFEDEYIRFEHPTGSQVLAEYHSGFEEYGMSSSGEYVLTTHVQRNLDAFFISMMKSTEWKFRQMAGYCDPRKFAERKADPILDNALRLDSEVWKDVEACMHNVHSGEEVGWVRNCIGVFGQYGVLVRVNTEDQNWLLYESATAIIESIHVKGLPAS